MVIFRQESLHNLTCFPTTMFFPRGYMIGLLSCFMRIILKSFSANKDSYDIFERSPESSKDVFWRMLMDDKIVTKEEDDIYRYYWGKCGWVPDIFIYINTPPEVCFERLQSRSQDGDSKITLEYLQKVSSYYVDYIRSKKQNLYIVDGTMTPEKINKKIRDILRQCLGDAVA
jgi:deoxyadenosine/deoxycytidine kinase